MTPRAVTFLAALVAAFLFGYGADAWAQGAISQYGASSAGHLALYLGNGRVTDAGGPSVLGGAPQNSAQPGSRPSGLGIVNSGQGLALFSGYATSPYSQLLFGFDGNGNGVITLNAVGGGSPSLSFNINGTTFTPGSFAVPTANLLGGAAGALQGVTVGTGLSFGSNTLSTTDLRTDASNATLPTARTNLLAMPVINARDPAYGMKCDNSTDDQAALQAALTAAATKGSAVFISGNPSGATATCLLGSNVFPPSGTTLWTVPGTVTLKAKTGNVSSPLLIANANVSNILIYGLTIDGGGQDFGSANNVTNIYGGVTPADNIVFDHVRFQHTRGIALQASSNVTNSGVRDSFFTDIGNHWKTTQLTADRKQAFALCCSDAGSRQSNHGNFSINNTFSGIGLDPLSIADQHDFLAMGTTCYSNDGQIYATWQNPQPIAFPACVYALTSDSINVVGTRCDGIPGNCVDTDTIADRVITNTMAYNSGNSGIGVFGLGNAAISGAILKNGCKSSICVGAGQQGGISLSGALGYVSISGVISTDDENSISTTCSGTVGIGATNCTMAAVTGMIVGDEIKIAGAGAAAADLTSDITSINGSVVSWRTATSTSTTNPAVTGVQTQQYGIFGKSGVTFAALNIGGDSSFAGNLTGPFGGTLPGYQAPFTWTSTLGSTGGSGVSLSMTNSSYTLNSNTHQVCWATVIALTATGAPTSVTLTLPTTPASTAAAVGSGIESTGSQALSVGGTSGSATVTVKSSVGTAIPNGTSTNLRLGGCYISA